MLFCLSSTGALEPVVKVSGRIGCCDVFDSFLI
jgi:hypothetical protein